MDCAGDETKILPTMQAPIEINDDQRVKHRLHRQFQFLYAVWSSRNSLRYKRKRWKRIRRRLATIFGLELWQLEKLRSSHLCFLAKVFFDGKSDLKTIPVTENLNRWGISRRMLISVGIPTLPPRAITYFTALGQRKIALLNKKIRFHSEKIACLRKQIKAVPQNQLKRTFIK
jgi:hypothetical protein